MLSRLICLTTISVVALSACATQQENPFYKYSSKYEGGAPITMAQGSQYGSTVQTVQVSQPVQTVQTYEQTKQYQSSPVTYQQTTYPASQQVAYTRIDPECLKKEQNHELIGAGVGGTIGAIAGKKLIGGTKGTVIGAGLGGAAGYGIGDKTVNCDPEPYVMLQSTPAVAEAYVSPTDTQFQTITGEGTPGYQVIQSQTASAHSGEVITGSAITSTSGQAQEVTYDYSANAVSAFAETTPIQTETRLLAGNNVGRSHLVKQGDTVYSLSRRLCVGVDEIQSLNGLDSGYNIKIGQALQLPSPRC